MNASVQKVFAFAAFLALPACATPGVPAPADKGKGNALALLDAYLAQAAPTTPEYRADLRPGRGPAELPAGQLSGCGPILGPFTYRPKTYGELSPAARVALLREPNLRAFLSQAGKWPRPQSIDQRFSIGPEEMLGARSFAVSLPSR